jgi:hypothetical protein
MKHIYLPLIFCFSVSALSAQILITEDNFDNYTAGQGIANQSPSWESYSSADGGVDDAEASTEYAFSGSNSMKIVVGKDMLYLFGDASSGAFTIEFNLFLHEQGSFNLQHENGANYALEIYLTADNKIKYLDEPGAVLNSEIIGTYVNDQWTHFQFTVDMDLDTVLTYKDGVLLHADRFSNSRDGEPSIHLDVLNFYGMGEFNGVENSHYYIDDYKVMIVTGLTAVPALADNPEITVFPNPAKEVLTVNAGSELKQLTLTDLSGQLVLEKALSGNETQLSLAEFPAGIYLVTVKSETGSKTQRLAVQ